MSHVLYTGVSIHCILYGKPYLTSASLIAEFHTPHWTPIIDNIKATMATVGHRIPLNPYHATVPHWTPLTPLDSLNQSVEFHLPEGTKE